MKNISRTLAQFCLGLKYEDIPTAAIHESKRFLLDSLGCALAAINHEDMLQARKYISSLEGPGHCSIIGTAQRASMPDATLMNALLIRAMDYNDIYWEQDPSHPSDIIPAALCPAQKLHLSGKELILGIVLAYEIEMRLCHAADPGIREVGWHHASLTQFASPLVASRMLGLSEDHTVAALGISGSSHFTLGGVVAGKLSNMKNTADPMATEAGVRAAMLASTGYSGPTELFEGKEGVFHVISNVRWRPEEIIRELGSDFMITRCSYKAFPTEALTHQPISAVLSIREKHNLLPQDVDSILVMTTKRGADILSDPSKYKPDTKETADHSLPYCIATAMVKGSVLPSDFTSEAIFDPQVRAMLQRIKVVEDPQIDALFPGIKRARVRVMTRDGQLLEKETDYAKGSPEQPMTDDDIMDKYLSNAIPNLSAEKAHLLADAVMNLEKCQDVEELSRLWY